MSCSVKGVKTDMVKTDNHLVMKKNNLVQINRVSDPTPAPPLHGRGAAAAILCGWNPVGTPLPCRGGAGVGSLTKAHLHPESSCLAVQDAKRDGT